ncbi:hypothetical protein R3P38DRAFT_2538243, partial [Favolaschia claudopus]
MCSPRCNQAVTVFCVLSDTTEARRQKNTLNRNAARQRERSGKAQASTALKERRRQQRLAKKPKDVESRQLDTESDELCSEFPPVPPSRNLRHDIITGFCSDFDPAAFEEAGCAVCGTLTRKTKLTP